MRWLFCLYTHQAYLAKWWLDENLTKQSGAEIESDRIYVRIKNVETPNTWLLLDRPLKIISGSATSIRNIATLEFFVDAKLADKSGEYTGQIKFFVQNY